MFFGAINKVINSCRAQITKALHLWLFVRGDVLWSDNGLKSPCGIYDPFLVYGTKGVPLLDPT